MGVPLLFTDAAGTAQLIVVPYPGLFLNDQLFLGDGVFLDDGPTLDFYATPPVVGAFGVTVSVDPEPVTFSGAEAILSTAGQYVVSVDPWPVLFRGEEITTSGLPVVVVSVPVPIVFGAEIPATSGGQLLILIPSIRELPPLRLTHHLVTPSGRHFRWAPDDPNPTLVPSGERFGDTMPGGFETADCVLPRKPGTDYSDVERLSTWQILGAGSEVAWEGRLERAPRVSGDQMSVSPSAVGWQAHLEDDKSALEVFVDIDLARWGPMGVQRRLALLGGFSALDGGAKPDDTSGRPSLALEILGTWTATSKPLVESSYRSPIEIGSVYYGWKQSNLNPADPNWTWDVLLSPDDMLSSSDSTGNLRATGPGTGTLGATNSDRKVATVRLFYNAGPAGTEGQLFPLYWTVLAVFGNHGLPKQGPNSPTEASGFFASDVVKYAVRSWAPLLTLTTESVQPSSFVIPHLVFLEPTTSAEIVRQATRFGLQDWAVWDDRTFWWHDRGAHGRKWRARVSPAQLEETGPSLERTWESVIVQFQDVDGTSRTVGPPGSGADTTSTLLKDSDPENPANLAGIVRRDLLQMGTSTAAGATEVGRRFLEESRQFDKSGRARFVGHVEDDRGVLHPYWKPRAGDYVTFIDSNDTSYRRIVRTDKDHASRTCSVDLDAPPEGLQALLERLGVVLVPLGFS